MTVWVKELREEELVPVNTVPQGVWKRYVSAEDGSRGMIMGMGKLAPEEEISHAHDEEELFYVLRGMGEATWVVDGQSHKAELYPGVAFYKTSGIEHTMRCKGREPLVGIFFKV
jgi:quercetin dioxygenase-like cupin family protein